MAGRKRASTRRRRTGARRTGQRSRKLGLLARIRAVELEQRHRDALGLALIAAGVYLGFVFYLDWEGGYVGTALAEGLEHAIGALTQLAPFLLVAWGAALALRPLLAASVRLGGGSVAILAGVLLALAAGTVGTGPERLSGTPSFELDLVAERGGVAGEGLWWVAATLFQQLGANLIAIALVAAGLVLASGGSLAGLVAAIARGVRAVRAASASLARAVPLPSAPTWPERAESEAPDSNTLDGFGSVNTDHPFAPEEETEDGQLALAEGEPVIAVPIAPPEPAGEEPAVERTPMGNRRDGVTTSDEIAYKLPSSKLLEVGAKVSGPDRRGQEEIGQRLIETLNDFGVQAQLTGVVGGPHVSRYELKLAPGTKVSKVSQLADDLAYALASTEIRILAPIPGKQAVGVEVPNLHRRLVRLGDIYRGLPKDASPLAAWLGTDISGNAVWADLAVMPHLLVAGATGSGKSGCVNAILTSILLHASPNEVRMVLIDPKRVELNHYESIPHLLTPVVTAPRLAANVLSNLIAEMESRYGVMGEARTRNLVELNKARVRKGEPPLPQILCVVDELADLMMVAPAEVEEAIIRLAQKSRAVGIHLLLATQRPSTDIITGSIKVNVPARIAFAVASQVDSRVILDQNGAETLLGRGDMLFRPVGTSRLQRLQGAFVDEDEIARVTGDWAAQGEPEFVEELLAKPSALGEEGDHGDFDPDSDELLDEAIRLAVSTQTASVSMIQRRLRVGYTRAGRLIDMLERRGVISGYEGSKPRQVLVTEADLGRVLAAETADGAPEPEEVGATGAAEPITSSHVV